MRLQPLYGKRMLTAAVILLGAALLLPKPAVAVTPESPEVQKRVQNALKFLDSAVDQRLGGECLIGLCFIKAGRKDHPKVAAAVKACENGAAILSNTLTIDNYSLGIALMFLCEADPQKHHDLIQKYVDELLRRQKTFGGWSYVAFNTGDTSQTQYAVLGMWMAKNFAEIDIPVDAMEGVCGWLMRTQTPAGAWGYQGIDPGSLNLIQQSPITPTLAASGSGAMYMAADFLQVTQRVDGVAGKPKSAALQEVEVPGKKKVILGPLTKVLNPADIKNTLASADRNLGNGFASQEVWNYYYMYALERYHSFREKAGGAKNDKWYDEGFAHLAKEQKSNGSWGEGQDLVVNTCFATLFLLRSAQKVIAKQQKLLMGDGKMVAGMRLPKDIKALDVTKDGKLVDKGIAISTDLIIDLIGKEGENEDVTRLADKREALELSNNKSDRDRQIEKLRKFVGAGDYNARLVAVMTLSKVRDLDNVPRLLYALTDKEPQIVLQADRGLRFISRKINGVGLPEGDPTTIQIKAAQTAWRDWYLSIRPNAELLD